MVFVCLRSRERKSAYNIHYIELTVWVQQMRSNSLFFLKYVMVNQTNIDIYVAICIYISPKRECLKCFLKTDDLYTK